MKSGKIIKEIGEKSGKLSTSSGKIGTFILALYPLLGLDFRLFFSFDEKVMIRRQ